MLKYEILNIVLFEISQHTHFDYAQCDLTRGHTERSRSMLMGLFKENPFIPHLIKYVTFALH